MKRQFIALIVSFLCAANVAAQQQTGFVLGVFTGNDSLNFGELRNTLKAEWIIGWGGIGGIRIQTH